MAKENTLTLEQAQKMMYENGGWLDLSGTSITALPDNLTVGGSLDLRGTSIKKRGYKILQDGDYVPGRYLYADGILTHVKNRREIKGYVFYQGKIKCKNVIFDGKNYAHCSTFSDGVADLIFKDAKDRGADGYKHLTLDSELSTPEMITMYRVITGACKQGTEAFVSSIRDLKEKYTVREAIELTAGQYNAKIFKNFFSGEE